MPGLFSSHSTRTRAQPKPCSETNGDIDTLRSLLLALLNDLVQVGNILTPVLIQRRPAIRLNRGICQVPIILQCPGIMLGAILWCPALPFFVSHRLSFHYFRVTRLASTRPHATG